MVRWLRWHCPPDTGFEIRPLAVWGRAPTSRSRRLPTILTFTRGWGRNMFVSFKPPRPGTERRTLAWKAAVLATTLWPLLLSYCHCYSDKKQAGWSRKYVTTKVTPRTQSVSVCSPPEDTRRWTNAGLMLVHRLRRWTNIKTALEQRLVFTRQKTQDAGCTLVVCWLNVEPRSVTLVQY